MESIQLATSKKQDDMLQKQDSLSVKVDGVNTKANDIVARVNGNTTRIDSISTKVNDITEKLKTNPAEMAVYAQTIVSQINPNSMAWAMRMGKYGDVLSEVLRGEGVAGYESLKGLDTASKLANSLAAITAICKSETTMLCTMRNPDIFNVVINNAQILAMLVENDLFNDFIKENPIQYNLMLANVTATNTIANSAKMMETIAMNSNYLRTMVTSEHGKTAIKNSALTKDISAGSTAITFYGKCLPIVTTASGTARGYYGSSGDNYKEISRTEFDWLYITNYVPCSKLYIYSITVKALVIKEGM